MISNRAHWKYFKQDLCHLRIGSPRPAFSIEIGLVVFVVAAAFFRSWISLNRRGCSERSLTQVVAKNWWLKSLLNCATVAPAIVHELFDNLEVISR
jgi:hypothetical protein